MLPEKREILRAIPKDEDSFDSFGNILFRDSYRIRSEDVYDLSFLLANRRIATYRTGPRGGGEELPPGLGRALPILCAHSVPGEPILVTRMIYEVIKRLDIAKSIEPSRVIYFDSQQVGGYSVKFLEELLRDHTENGVTDFGDKTLAITYRFDRQASLAEGRLGTEPIPEIRLLDCPDRKVWSKLLWELNQPLPDGQPGHTILIQNDSDIVRLLRGPDGQKGRLTQRRDG